MNIFQSDYETRLKDWHNLKKSVADKDLRNKSILIDNWWQKAPLVTHYLHTKDLNNWPNPWELLVENTYCEVARALGMCYTLYMIGEVNVKMVEATDHLGNDVILVIVNEEYVLNYWPNTVETNSISNFTEKKQVNIKKLLEKYGNRF